MDDKLNIDAELLGKVSGGMTEERREQLLRAIRNAKIIGSSLESLMKALQKNGATLEDLVFVKQNW